jgi:hypothetical protein
MMNLNKDIFTVNKNKLGFILNKTFHKKYLNNWFWSGKLLTVCIQNKIGILALIMHIFVKG